MYFYDLMAVNLLEHKPQSVKQEIGTESHITQSLSLSLNEISNAQIYAPRESEHFWNLNNTERGERK